MNRISQFLSKLHKSRKTLPAVLVIVLALGVVPPARASVADIIMLLNTITSTLRNSIGAVLSEIRTVENTINTLHQEIVWPLTMINQAKGFVSATINQYKGLLNQIHTLEIESATLVNPTRLETAFRTAAIGSLTNIQPAYVKVYSPVPQPTDANVPERNMMDMDDALAIGSLKSASISDQTSDQMLQLADSIEQQSSAAAPGSAPLLSAQAQIANLESQAYLAKTLATELRVEATKLAHDNALLKRSAEHSTTLHDHIQQVLK